MSTYDTIVAEREFDRIYQENISNNPLYIQADDDKKKRMEENAKNNIKRLYVLSAMSTPNFEISSLSAQNLYDLVKDFGITQQFNPKNPDNPEDLTPQRFEQYCQYLGNHLLKRAIELKQSPAADNKDLLAKYTELLQSFSGKMSDNQQKLFKSLLPKVVKKASLASVELRKENIADAQALMKRLREHKGKNTSEVMTDLALTQNKILDIYGKDMQTGEEQAVAMVQMFAINSVQQKLLDWSKMGRQDFEVLKNALENQNSIAQGYTKAQLQRTLHTLEQRIKAAAEKEQAAEIAVINMATPETIDQTATNEEIGAEKPADKAFEEILPSATTPLTIDELANEPAPEEVVTVVDTRVSPALELQAMSIMLETNLTNRRIVFERSEKPVVATEIEYALYPTGQKKENSQVNGQLTMHDTSKYTLKSQDYGHYAALVQNLYQNGFRQLEVGNLSDDAEQNKQFKATLVLAGASYGMPASNVDLEELKEVDPKIQILIEKRKMRAEINDLHRQLETAEGDRAEQLRSELKSKIEAAVQHYVEKGSIDKDKDAKNESMEQRLERLKTMVAAPDDNTKRQLVDKDGKKHDEDDGHHAVRLAKRALNKEILSQVVQKTGAQSK